MAQKNRGQQVFDAEVEFRQKVEIPSGKLSINGTAVTVTAAQINAMAGSTIVVDPIMEPVVEATSLALARTAMHVSAVDVAQTFSGGQRFGVTALTSTTNSTPIDLALNNNFSALLTEDTTFANPTNLVAGQKGSIYITQDATAAKTLAFGTAWLFAGGVDPSVSTGLGAIDVLSYEVISETQVIASLAKAFA